MLFLWVKLPSIIPVLKDLCFAEIAGGISRVRHEQVYSVAIKLYCGGT